MRAALPLVAALAAAAAVTAVTACHAPSGCASDVCTAGTVHRAAPAADAWSVRGDDGTTYEVEPALPPLFRREGLRVRIVARERGRRSGNTRPVQIVRLETL